MFRRYLFGAALAAMSTTGLMHSGVVDNVKEMLSGPQMVETPAVSVLLAHDVESALVEVRGKYHVIDPRSGKVLGRRVHGKKQYVYALRHGVKWGEEFLDVYQIRIVPTDPSTQIFVNGQQYPGAITIFDVGETVSIVNEVDIEEFVVAALASKIDHEVPPEALNAVAITQRTNAYYRSTYPRNPYWDVDAGHVGYRGSEVLPTTAQAQRAVAATLGMVLSRENPEDPEGQFVHLFRTHWRKSHVDPDDKRPTLLLTDAVKRAKSGENAASILYDTFPGAHVERMFPVQ